MNLPPDFKDLAVELRYIAENGVPPEGQRADGSIEMWAMGWFLTLLDLGVPFPRLPFLPSDA